MAVLAVAFVVLAAVPVALTDSDAADTTVKVTTVTDDPTEISSTTTNYYITDSKSVTLSQNAQLIIVPAGKTLTLTSTGAKSVNVAIGQKNSDGSYQYDSTTYITYTTGASSSSLVLVASENGGYFTLTDGTSGSLTRGVSVKSTSSTTPVTTVYGITSTVDAKLYKDSDTVVVKSPSNTDPLVTTNVTVSFSPTTSQSDYKAGSISISAKNKSDKGIDLSVSLDGTAKSLKLTIGSSGFESGTIEAKSGQINLAAACPTGADIEVHGLYEAVSTTKYTLFAFETVQTGTAMAASTNYTILAGTKASDADVTLGFGTAKANYFTFSKGFEAKADITITGATSTLTLSDTASAASYDGKITLLNANAIIGELHADEIETKAAQTTSGSLTLYGKLTLGGDLVLSDVISFEDGSSVSQGTSKIALADTKTITVGDGASVTADFRPAAVANDVFVSLKNVEGGATPLVITQVASTSATANPDTIAGQLMSGSVTMGSIFATASGGLVIGQDASVTLLASNTKALDVNTDGLTVLGQIDGTGTVYSSSAAIEVATKDAKQAGHVLCKVGSNVTIDADVAAVDTISTEVLLINAIGLGYTDITCSWATAITTTQNISIPEGTIVKIVKGMTVGEDKSLDNEGKIISKGAASGDVTVGVVSGGVIRNTGLIGYDKTGAANADMAISVPAGATFVNSGEVYINKSGSVIAGTFENSGTLYVEADMVIGTYDDAASPKSSSTEFENSGKIFVTNTMDIEVKKGSKLINNGTIDVAKGTASLSSNTEIRGDGTFENGSEGTVGIYVNTKYVSGSTSTLIISQDMTQKITYMSLQTLQIPAGATLKLTNVANTVVNGKMIIDGDLTIYGILVIAANADAQSAELVVNGNITVEDGGVLKIGDSGKGKLTLASGASIVVKNGGELDVEMGSATIKGSLSMDEGSVLAVDGTMVSSSAKATMSVSGTADLNGYLKGSVAISNSGVISIDNGSNAVRESDVNTNLTINMAKDGAVLNVDSFLLESYASTSLVITDKGLVTYTDSNNKKTTIPSTNYDQISIGMDTASATLSKAVAEGTLVIKQSASYKTVDSYTEKAQTYSMDVSGEISGQFTFTGTTPTTITDRVTLAIQTAGKEYYKNSSGVATDDVQNSGSVEVTDELEIGQYVVTTVSALNSGVLSVSGIIGNDASGAQKISVANGATIDVSGLIVSSNQIDVTSKGKVNAVYYMTTIEENKVKTNTYYYTTLDAAIEGVQVEGNTADKVVKIIGKVTLLEDVTLPETVQMQFYDRTSYLTIGSSTVRPTLTAEAEITTQTQQITVNGTLLFVDKDDDKTVKTVSDVMYEIDDSKVYTNVYTAIEQAAIVGDDMTITVTKESGVVELSQNLTVPSNVTLVVKDSVHGAGLKLMDGVTLTVEGVLKTSQDIVAESRFAVNALDVDTGVAATTYKSSAVVVNGKLMIADSETPVYGNGAAAADATSLVASAPVYGAWYQVSGWYVISNINDALAETKVTSTDITVNGPVVGSDGTVTANNLGFGKLTIGTTSGVKMYGSVTTAIANTLTMNSLTLGSGTVFEIKGAYTGSVVVGENSVGFAKISGTTLQAANVDGAFVLNGTTSMTTKDQSLAVTAGTVSLGGKIGTTDAAFVLSQYYYYMTVSAGATAVAGGAGSNSIAGLTVDGTLEVPASATLSVGYLQVNGSVKVADTTASATGGSMTITTGYVGISSYDSYDYNTALVTAASASVSGPFTLNGKMSVANGAAVDQDMSSYAKTEVYNNGSLWFTAYAEKDASDKAVYLNKAPLTNAVLAGWATSDGGDIVKNSSGKAVTSFTIGTYSKLYSVVETEIYTIIIKADTGIGDLYLNGNIMQKGQIQYTESGVAYYYNAYVATVSYGTYEVTCKLANGYSGTAVLKDSTGASVSANKFTTPEATDYTDVNFQLTGIEKSGYVQPTEEKKDNGLTVTDYLLIVLVILVVILAVIVALRLMRS